MGEDVDVSRMGVTTFENREYHEDGDEGNNQRAQHLHHRGVTEVGEYRLHGGGGDDGDDLLRAGDVYPGVLQQNHHGAHDENQTFGFKAQLSNPVEERHDATAIGAKGRSTGREGGGTGLGAL